MSSKMPNLNLENSLTFTYLKDEALGRGFSFKRLTDFGRVVHVITDDVGREFFLFGANCYPDLSAFAMYVTKNKSLMHDVLKFEGVPMPQYRLSSNFADLSAWIDNKGFFNEGGVVLKPNNAGLGKMVHFHLSEDNLRINFEEIFSKYGNCLIQECVLGEDVRVQVVGGRFFAACRRIPANIVGDGLKKVSELIDLKNVHKARYSSKNLIKVDDSVKAFLKKQGLNLDSVIEKGVTVFLRSASNIGLGGDPVDITNDIHSDYARLVERISLMINAKTFAVDFIASDYRLSFAEGGAYFIEVNAPCMWAHHHFAEGVKRNVAAAILDAHFEPEGFDPGDSKYLSA